MGKEAGGGLTIKSIKSSRTCSKWLYPGMAMAQ